MHMKYTFFPLRDCKQNRQPSLNNNTKFNFMLAHGYCALFKPEKPAQLFGAQYSAVVAVS